MFRAILITLCVILLSSCSLLSPVKVTPPTLYVIDSVPQPPVKKSAHHRITLLVTQPQANAVYNTTQMAYTIKPHQVAYFAKNRWAETPPRMLQPLIVQTLQKTHHFNVVSSASGGTRYDYILNTQLLRLEQEFLPDSSLLHLTLRAQLVNAVNGKVVATKQFFSAITVEQDTPYGGVIAANTATASVLNRLAVFCLQKLRHKPTRPSTYSNL